MFFLQVENASMLLHIKLKFHETRKDQFDPPGLSSIHKYVLND